jgi:hypothetical protein
MKLMYWDEIIIMLHHIWNKVTFIFIADVRNHVSYMHKSTEKVKYTSFFWPRPVSVPLHQKGERERELAHMRFQIRKSSFSDASNNCMLCAFFLFPLNGVCCKKQKFSSLQGEFKMSLQMPYGSSETLPRPKNCDLELCIVERNYREQIC